LPVLTCPQIAGFHLSIEAKSGNEDLQLFHRVVTAYITAGNAASRRAQAGGLAELLAPNRNV
jgi:hypothetical protein